MDKNEYCIGCLFAQPKLKCKKWGQLDAKDVVVGCSYKKGEVMGEPTEAQIWEDTKLRIPANWRTLTWAALKEVKNEYTDTG